MSIVCPTILAHTPNEFAEQMERLTPFATRVQIDLTDGDFAEPKTVNLNQVDWPENWAADLHLMFKRPLEWAGMLASLKPHLVIIHAEAEGGLADFTAHLQKFGIKVGVALLPETTVDFAEGLIKLADHVLLFGGNLGKMGGGADLANLSKVEQVRAIKPNVEIGWDGGANLENIAKIAKSGVDVINVGSAIQSAQNPADAFLRLTKLI